MELNGKATYDNVSFENYEKSNGEIPVETLCPVKANIISNATQEPCPVKADIISNTTQAPTQWDIAIL